MLIRMTTSIRTRVAQFAVVVLAVFASSAVAATLATTADRHQTALVVGPGAAPDVVARAQDAAARAGAQLRVVKSTADQLGVTHVLAAQGYDTVVTVGVDRRTAIAPVAKRYPETRFVEADSNQLHLALSR
jgi:basic membrane lipoprotein Med (substrate-binding protein (PBP1-ABC) superfamily)